MVIFIFYVINIYIPITIGTIHRPFRLRRTLQLQQFC